MDYIASYAQMFLSQQRNPEKVSLNIVYLFIRSYINDIYHYYYKYT